MMQDAARDSRRTSWHCRWYWTSMTYHKLRRLNESHDTLVQLAVVDGQLDRSCLDHLCYQDVGSIMCRSIIVFILNKWSREVDAFKSRGHWYRLFRHQPRRVQHARSKHHDWRLTTQHLISIHNCEDFTRFNVLSPRLVFSTLGISNRTVRSV